MIEISTALLVFLIESIVILLLLIVLWTIITGKRNNKDKKAVDGLIKQIKHQSQTRLQETGSFLKEKYHFEEGELIKAVKLIDKAEKKFLAKIINIYLTRDSVALANIDACLAELIDSYKSLTPAMPDPEELENTADFEELEKLREAHSLLTDELNLTKKTMGNMVAEFGNMFGGGSEHEIEHEEIMRRFSDKEDKQDQPQEQEASIDLSGTALDDTDDGAEKKKRESDDAVIDLSEDH